MPLLARGHLLSLKFDEQRVSTKERSDFGDCLFDVQYWKQLGNANFQIV